MAFIPVPETVEVEVRMQLAGQRIENTLYFSKSGGWDIASATTLGNDVLVWWATLYNQELANDLELIEVVVSDLDVVDSFQVSLPAPTPHPRGVNTSDALPSNVALCISFRTPFRGRSFRGRNYISGLPAGSVVGNVVSTTVADAMQSAYETLPFSTTSAGGTWVVVSRFTDNAPRVTGVATPITAVLVVDRDSDSMRRRLNGRGT